MYEELSILLTDNEQKVYLELLKSGKSKAKEILKKTHLQNSVFYRTIDNLIEKGFISFTIKKKIREFIASPPEILLEKIKEKEKKIENILPKLVQLKSFSPKTNVQIYEDFAGIKTMLCDQIRGGKSKDCLVFGFQSKIHKIAMEKIFLDLRPRYKEKGIKKRAIFPEEYRKYVIPSKEILFKFSSTPLPATMSIYEDKCLIGDLESETPIGILIQNKVIADQYKEYFESFWKIAKK
jgi:sugar-specific transcriptional regulator TrmB